LTDTASSTPIAPKLGVPQYFFDDELISYQHKLTRRWLPATVYPKPVVEPDKPWEPRILDLFGTVLEKTGGGYRMYYTGFTGIRTINLKVFVAESEDGFHWTKPELGIVEWNGSRANNISLDPDHRNDGPSVIFDPEDAEHPYKLVMFGRKDIFNKWGPDWGIYGYGSEDGLTWHRRKPEVMFVAGDRTNAMARKSDGKYVIYTRHREMAKRVGARAIYRTESTDFKSWTEPELVLAPDLVDRSDVEYYGMSVFERNGWYFGMLEYFFGDVDTVETYLVFSRDGKTWRHPTPRGPFIAGDYDWNRTWSSCANNAPVVIGDSMLFYFGGKWKNHHYTSALQLTGIGWASLPIDRFCAIEGKVGGRLVTTPITWPGGDLVLNVDTRESYDCFPTDVQGQIAIEVHDAEGSPLPEWSGENKAIYKGNTYICNRKGQHDIEWPNGKSFSELKGRTIRLVFSFHHARLFTFAAEEKNDQDG